VNINLKLSACLLLGLLVLAGCGKRFVDDDDSAAEPVSFIPVESEASAEGYAADKARLETLFEESISPILEEPISTENAPLAQVPSEEKQ
jgi:hypothetical protein